MGDAFVPDLCRPADPGEGGGTTGNAPISAGPCCGASGRRCAAGPAGLNDPACDPARLRRRIIALRLFARGAGEGTTRWVTARMFSSERLSRDDFLKLAAAAGGAGLLAGPTAVAEAARRAARGGVGPAPGARLGRLRLRRRSGDVRAPTSRSTRRTSRSSPYMANEADALAKLQQGVKPGHLPPLRRLGEVLRARAASSQPWDPKLIPNFKHLNPLMVKAGQYKGKQYGIPEDWGFDAVLYRTDKVQARRPRSWGLLFDERYKGKIAWFDDGSAMLVDDRPLPRFQEPVEPDRRAARRGAEVPHLEEARRPHDLVLRDRHSGQAFGSGDVWIAYAWPNDWVQMRRRSRTAGRLHASRRRSRICVGRHADARSRARRARSSRTRTSMPGARRESAKWLEDNYGYGHANLKARPSSSDLLRALKLGNPKAVGRAERVHRPRHPAARLSTRRSGKG